MFELYLGLDFDLIYFGSYSSEEIALKWRNKYPRLKAKIISENGVFLLT